MTRLIRAALLLSATLAAQVALAGESTQQPEASTASGAQSAAEDGFEPVDPATLEQVSGLPLMISAYAVILGALVLYALLLLVRERAVLRAIEHLERQLEHRSER